MMPFYNLFIERPSYKATLKRHQTWKYFTANR